jgi:putative endonuclease
MAGPEGAESNGALSEPLDRTASRRAHGKSEVPDRNRSHGVDRGVMPVTYWVYILRCADGSLYVGETSCMAERLQRHHDGRGSLHTSSRLPVTLLYSEEHSTQSSACRRERQIKRWTHEKKLALAEGRLETLKGISRRNRQPER